METRLHSYFSFLPDTAIHVYQISEAHRDSVPCDRRKPVSFLQITHGSKLVTRILLYELSSKEVFEKLGK